MGCPAAVQASAKGMFPETHVQYLGKLKVVAHSFPNHTCNFRCMWHNVVSTSCYFDSLQEYTGAASAPERLSPASPLPTLSWSRVRNGL